MGRAAASTRTEATSPVSRESNEIQGLGETLANTSSRERKSPEARSTGAFVPVSAAASHAAWRNSRLVWCKISARAATF